jgi:hypothetical protein
VISVHDAVELGTLVLGWWNLRTRLRMQDRVLEAYARMWEQHAKKMGSIPPPRPKLCTFRGDDLEPDVRAAYDAVTSIPPPRGE